LQQCHPVECVLSVPGGSTWCVLVRLTWIFSRFNSAAT
jgi:hypothetical protein